MNKEGSPELTKSWVFIDLDKKNCKIDEKAKDTSGIQELMQNEPHTDSDTDSISVISESGGSYRTDEDEIQSVITPRDKEAADDNITTEENEEKKSGTEENKSEIAETIEEKKTEIIEPKLLPIENRGIEKILYFATSAVCAIILIGLSVAVQQYLQGASDINKYETDQDFTYPDIQNVKTENVLSENYLKKYNFKRKNQFNVNELENKIDYLQKDNQIHDKVVAAVEDNDPKLEKNVNSNYKPNKNKSFKCNKENCEAKYKNVKIRRDDLEWNDEKMTEKDEKRSNDESYTKKIKELRIKEDYLREKEKFLIEKEHYLLEKEMKFNKERNYYEKNKHDKESYNKKEKQYKLNSSEDNSGQNKGKFKINKEYSREKAKNNKKIKYKDEKNFKTQKRYKNTEESNRKRNISGQWYMNLHEARDSMRQRRRANFKKNKAHWYFQWMVDRARLRVK